MTLDGGSMKRCRLINRQWIFHREKIPGAHSVMIAVVAMAAVVTAQNPIGWASISGATTGGAGGTTVTVTNETDLVSNAKSSSAMIIKVSGKISCDRVNVASNKTIEGAASGATVAGSLVMYGKSSAPVKNVIISNLVIAPESGSFEDAISMQFADHIWVDHCDVSDKRSTLDGLCDMTHACDYITISWTKFSYPNNTTDHRFCMLISHSDDNASEDLGHLKITLHHDWWAQNVFERMPRMRFCQVHSFNNYFSAAGNNYCIGAGVQAQVRVESDYFDGVSNPHEFYDGETTAIIATNTDNQYINTTGKKDVGQGTCFTPPYSYKLDAGSSVKNMVMSGAGPFKTVAIESIPFEPAPVKTPFARPAVKAFAVTLQGSLLPVASVQGSFPYIIINSKPSVRSVVK